MATKKPYHKEDLRGDLLKAGRAWIAANGHVGFSMRTLAQQVGVSPGAPYHHFPDRRAFLLALALDGFREMLARSDAIAATFDHPADKLRALGAVFIQFAEESPHLVDLMYESELTTPAIDPELLAFQMRGHTAVRAAVAASIPGLDEEAIELRTLAFWSAIYGFASMRRKGVIRPVPGSVSGAMIADKLAEAIAERAIVAALAP
ncbi:TetR family transcriptional regulator [Novosphingobium fuchskuhlense]|uniref:TetR family transcriptional regulator n=1 Tax=Novosphingobium fuchskuhlense TaxID=1117702 RepID=A0A124JUW7_9SPHN|nr:TetR/AcrR family transcriptional regulator [Novosphingobium fuchskuhlense]KUR71673.1 TetR family transcriptional regulator [Novosphingobium fuchskuhlense]